MSTCRILLPLLEAVSINRSKNRLTYSHRKGTFIAVSVTVDSFYLRGLFPCTSEAENYKKRPLHGGLYVFTPLTYTSAVGHCQAEDTSLGMVALNESAGFYVFMYFTSPTRNINTLFTFVTLYLQ